MITASSSNFSYFLCYSFGRNGKHLELIGSASVIGVQQTQVKVRSGSGVQYYNRAITSNETRLYVEMTETTNTKEAKLDYAIIRHYLHKYKYKYKY